MEEELNQGVLSAEKILDTDLGLSNGPDKEPLDSGKVPLDSDKKRLDSDKEPLDSDKKPLEPDKEPLDSDKEPFDSAKEPLDSDKEPIDSDKDQFYVPPHASRVETEETTEKGSCVDVLEESQHKLEHEQLSEPTVLLDTKTENNGPGTGFDAVESYKEGSSTAEERSGASGLHILTNQAGEDMRTEITLSPSQKKKDTSEITDEGAVKKLDTSEAGVETLQLPKPWKGRPNAGCRLMVEVSAPTTVSLNDNMDRSWAS